MDVHKILQTLYDERTRIERAIPALESLDDGPGNGGGRDGDGDSVRTD